MFKYLSLILESKTSSAYKAAQAQEDLLFKETHGRYRTKKERRASAKKIGEHIRNEIEIGHALDRDRDAHIPMRAEAVRKSRTGKQLSPNERFLLARPIPEPANTTRARTLGQIDLLRYLADVARAKRKGRGKP